MAINLINVGLAPNDFTGDPLRDAFIKINSMFSELYSQPEMSVKAANLVYAGPASGVSALPSFRALVAADIPDLSGAYSPVGHTHTLADLTDTVILGLASGQILYYNGLSWANTTLASAGIAAASHTHAASDITDLSSYTGLDGRYYTEIEINNFFAGVSPMTGYNRIQWDNAFNWGNHAIAGYLTGNQTITLSGDVTGSGATAITTTIANGVVTYAKIQDGAARTLLGRSASDSGPIAGISTDLSSNHVMRELGGVIGWGLITGANITDSTITYIKIQNVAANSFLANETGGPSPIQAIAINRIPFFGSAITGTANNTTFLRGDGTWGTPTGVTNLSYAPVTRVISSDTGVDAILPLVQSFDAGLAPASGGGTTNFLRADGTWAAPPTGSSYTFSNGLTENAGAVKLGGALTEDTTLSGAFLFGVGVTPISKLHVKGNGTTTGQLFRLDDSANATKLLVTDNGNMYVTGNLGVGLNPSFKFDVNGVANFRNVIQTQKASGLAIPSFIKDSSAITSASGITSIRSIDITPIYNLTGTYVGTMYGIDYNPTLTSMVGVTHVAAYFRTGEVRIGEITQDDALTQVVVRDSVTGQLKYRASATLSGGSLPDGAPTVVSSASLSLNPIKSYNNNTIWNVSQNGRISPNFSGVPAGARGIIKVRKDNSATVRKIGFFNRSTNFILATDIITELRATDESFVDVAAFTVTNAANNGSGLIRITTSAAHGLSTGNRVEIESVGGTIEANAKWTITVIDTTTFDLQGSVFTTTYTSGGTGYLLDYFLLLNQTALAEGTFEFFEIDGKIEIHGNPFLL